MPVFAYMIQHKPIRDFDLSKLHMISCEGAHYRQILMLLHPHLHKILIRICMKWPGEGAHTMPVEMSGQKASVRQSKKEESGTKMERKKD